MKFAVGENTMKGYALRAERLCHLLNKPQCTVTGGEAPDEKFAVGENTNPFPAQK
jgi:hypothetical protein